MTTSNYFANISTIDELRTAYKRLVLELHPDKGGDEEAFKAMQNEYENLISRMAAGEATQAKSENREAKYTYAFEKSIMEMLSKLVSIRGIEIEICGSWIWIGGETYLAKDQLKAFGFRWSKAKKRWYWSPYRSNRKFRSGWSMRKIRREYGSEIVEKDEKTANLLHD